MIARQSDVATDATRRPRIAVLMNNRVNTGLIAATLDGAYEVVTGDAGEAAIERVDLIVIDGPSLHRCRSAISHARSRQRALYLPVVLLTEGDDPSMPEDLRSLVDDVLRRPVSKAELGIRLRALLRVRFLSREVVRVRDLYETERAVAQRFQEAAMTKNLPSVPGIALHAYYCAGHREALVGGDWYDALALDDGRLVMSIGDVCGSGLDAAVLMSHVRQVIRGVAHIHPDPQMMLDAVNRNLRAEYPDAIVTALAAVLDPITLTLEYANAGHVPALLRDVKGDVHTLQYGDLPLGVSTDAPRLFSVPMPPGSLLLMYTDGLTEFDRDLIGAQRRLEQALAEKRFEDRDNAAEGIFALMITGAPLDDVAILLVDYRASAERERWTFRSDDVEAFANVRSQVCERLDLLGVSSARSTTAEMIFAELIGNVVRHAPGNIDVLLETRNSKPILHVLDRGPSFSYAPRLPTNPLSENGRGLYLVKELSHDFNVSPRPAGGSHARVVLK